MKATGVVRSVDSLGRIVIPKELRRVMKIREGDPMEIYTETDGEVVLKNTLRLGKWLILQNSSQRLSLKVQA